MFEQKNIDLSLNANEKKDSRKCGVAFVCFEDQLMNYSSNLRFSTSTKNWRNTQQALKMGDYGGKFDPTYTLQRIDFIKNIVASYMLEGSDSKDVILEKIYNIKNGIEILEKLESICIAAQISNTQLRVMIGDFVGSI
jgi:hypothetical protein